MQRSRRKQFEADSAPQATHADRAEASWPRNSRLRRSRPWFVLAAALFATTAVGAAFAYYASDANLVVGYRPVQPIAFSHQLHAGDLLLDCRFCHTSVERSAMAGIPSSAICMACHDKVLPESTKLLPLRATFAENRPIEWVRVTKLADYSYFDHSAHVSVGIGCESCHGRVELMLRTEQRFSLSMGFCLDCHRKPEDALRPIGEVTHRGEPSDAPMTRTKPARAVSPAGRSLTPPLHCSGCHR